jgi:hypothetical protein
MSCFSTNEQYVKIVIIPDNYLKLTFGDISDVDSIIGGDKFLISTWNAFFDLPTNGTPFDFVGIKGNKVYLSGGGNITLKSSIFLMVNLLEIDDKLLSGITYLNNNCFTQTPLTYVNLPFVTGMTNLCFYNCHYITYFNMPLLEIAGISSLSGCHRLKHLNFPFLKTIGEECFYKCYSVSYIYMPLLETAGDYSLGNLGDVILDSQDDHIDYINLPSLTHIGDYGFYNCKLIKTYDLPSLLTGGTYCFGSNYSIETFNAESLKYIGNYSFYNCLSYNTGSTNLNLPVLEHMGSTVNNDSVFNNINNKIITLTIPSSLMVCNSGNPDGDITNLISNNTVDIIQI